MDVEPKDAITWGSILIAAGGFVNRVYVHGRRIKTLEKCLTTEDHEPRFMSVKIHTEKCDPVKETLTEIKDHLKEVDKKQNTILEAVIRLEAKSE